MTQTLLQETYVLRHVLGGRQTRSGFFYSPFVVDTSIEFDSLLHSGAEKHKQTLDSPLSTAPTSRAALPEPTSDNQTLESPLSTALTSRAASPEPTEPTPTTKAQDRFLEWVMNRLVDLEENQSTADVDGDDVQGKKRRRWQKRKLAETEEEEGQVMSEEQVQRPCSFFTHFGVSELLSEP
ncbi:hypothetical protein V5O48_018816 [Marasmius crinis-equi]|uniref:Uncharacterized protein n=1 Tax=Marasmius crinis-equi TaxID=585013 RepID=A0ABR3EK44_9AGAR